MSGDQVRIIVFGYHTIGYLCLNELIGRGEEIVAVVTHQDDPGERIWFESVAELARSSGIPVLTPRTPNTPDFISLVRSLQPDLLFSFYYRRLLSKELLSIPRLGAVNLHGSLLPKYRGRCPVNWVLINGEARTGVTLHYMNEEADAGDIIAQKEVAIALEDTALTLFQKLARSALELFRETFPLIKAGVAPRIPQDPHQATYYGGRRPEDGKIDWRKSALSLYNLIRALTFPYPGAFTFYRGRKLYVWGSRLTSEGRDGGGPPGAILGIQDGGVLIATGKGTLLLTLVQFQGEEVLSGDELIRRSQLSIDARLGEEN